MILESDIRQALDEKQFFLNYQPQLDLHTGTITGFEALVRWRHPKKGLIIPDSFIPTAEKNGTIVPICEYVMETAFEQIKKWNDLGLGKMTMAVNLSALQLEDKNLQSSIEGLIDKKQIDPSVLELEITESLPMKNAQRAGEVLTKLSEKIQVAVDDFGTGYSFNHLSTPAIKKLVKKLKIDKSFVQDIETNKKHEEIVKAFIDFGHRHKISVIAEGCETQIQLKKLKELGCDSIQGYYVSRPVSSEKAEEIIRKYNKQPISLILAKQKNRA